MSLQLRVGISAFIELIKSNFLCSFLFSTNRSSHSFFFVQSQNKRTLSTCIITNSVKCFEQVSFRMVAVSISNNGALFMIKRKCNFFYSSCSLRCRFHLFPIPSIITVTDSVTNEKCCSLFYEEKNNVNQTQNVTYLIQSKSN